MMSNPGSKDATADEHKATTQSWMKTSTVTIFCQLFPVLAANIGSFSSGLILGYSAILLPQIRPDEADFYDSEIGQDTISAPAYRPFTASVEEGSWIAGIFGLGAIFGGIFAAFTGNRYGRRVSLLLLAVPDLLGWILVASSQNLGMMLAGRFLAGFAAAGYSPNIQIYVGEITQPQHRGWMLGLTVPIMAIGVLTMYVVGSLLPWHFAAASSTLFPLLMVICVMFYGDSPYWYMHAGMEKCAHEALRQFRGSKADIEPESKEIIDLVKSEPQKISFVDGLKKSFLERKYFEPFIILNMLFFLKLLSGKFAIDFNAVEVIQKVSSQFNEYLSAVFMALIYLIGSLLFIPLVKRFSRKILIILSAFVMGVSLLVLGLCMYSQKYNSMQALQDSDWLPLTCIVSYMVAAPIGLCSIPFIYLAEFFPSEMRSVLGGLTIAISNLELFIVVKTFPNLEEVMGDYGVFWLYAAACFSAIIFTLIFVPETKDKDLSKVNLKFFNCSSSSEVKSIDSLVSG